MSRLLTTKTWNNLKSSGYSGWKMNRFGTPCYIRLFDIDPDRVAREFIGSTQGDWYYEDSTFYFQNQGDAAWFHEKHRFHVESAVW